MTASLVVLVVFVVVLAFFVMEVSCAEPFLPEEGGACQRCVLQDSSSFRYISIYPRFERKSENQRRNLPIEWRRDSER